MHDVAVELTVLAVDRVRQGGHLSVRQTEQLRRALATAGEHLGWAAMVAASGDPVGTASKDVAKLLKHGASALTDTLAEELSGKKTEMSRLEKSAKGIRKLAGDKKTEYPAELSYVHTAREASQGLITKTELVVVADPTEAEGVAQTIEKKLTSWDKLREQMILEVKQKQKYLGEVKSDIAEFVDATRQLTREVLATLH